MKKTESKLTRGQWRVWLQGIKSAGLLDRLPPTYDQEGWPDSRATADLVEELLAALRNPNLSRPDFLRLVAELEQFRSWVESCQKKSRQIILAENETAKTDPRWLEHWAASMIHEYDRQPPQTTRPPALSSSHPMWDSELDA